MGLAWYEQNMKSSQNSVNDTESNQNYTGNEGDAV